MPRKGDSMSEEQKRKIVESRQRSLEAGKWTQRIGWKHSQETKDKIAAGLTGNKNGQDQHHKASDETRRKQSESRKRLWARNRDNMLRQVDAARQNISFDSTSIEVTIANALYSLGVQFESQKSTYPWRLDFYCEELSLAIECDGDYWHSSPGTKAKDARRDRDLNGQGIRVLHLTETDIKHNLQGCLNSIISTIAQQVQLKESE